MRLLPSKVFLLAALVALTACGGGGGSDSATPPVSGPPPATNQPPGNPAPPTPATPQASIPTPRPATATAAAAGQWILFSGGGTLYRYDLDADAVTRLWAPGGPTVGASNTTVSPDGNWVAFTLYDGIARSDLWVMASSNGGSITGVSAPPPEVAGVGSFVWSPDSSRLAYVKLVTYLNGQDHTQQQYKEVWLVNRDGSDRRRLSAPVADPDFADDIIDLKWSPDGRYVSWMLFDAPDWVTEDHWRRYALDVHDTQGDALNRTRILAPAGVAEPEFSEYYEWAPDSSRLAFGAASASGNQVFTVRPDGAALAQVSQPLSPGWAFPHFLWSPDSSRLAFFADTQDALELYSVAPDGTGIVKLNAPLAAGTEVDYHIVWAPDGSRIAYAIRGLNYSDALPGLYTVRLDGSDRVRLDHATSAEYRIDLFKWAPDGSRLAYRLGAQFDDRKLYIVRPDGTDHFELEGMLRADPVPSGKGQGSPLSQHFDWSSDGAHLFYVAESATAVSPAELFSLRADTQVSAKLNDPVPASVSLEFAAFAWSKDGARAAYVVDDDGDGTKDLFVVAPNGAGYKNITKSFSLGPASLFSWSP